jgi:hypothetical protein
VTLSAECKKKALLISRANGGFELPDESGFSLFFASEKNKK